MICLTYVAYELTDGTWSKPISFLGGYLPRHNVRFKVNSKEQGTAFVPWQGSNLQDILCVQKQRTIGNDNTVDYHNKCLQICEDAHRLHQEN